MAPHPEDEKRDHILRFLYEHHKTARGIATIPIGVLDLKREMKERHDMKQNEVSSNLDYLIQVGLVREDDADALAYRRRDVVVDGGPEQLEVSGSAPEESRQDQQQCRLAGTVGADQSPLLAGRDRQVDIAVTMQQAQKLSACISSAAHNPRSDHAVTLA